MWGVCAHPVHGQRAQTNDALVALDLANAKTLRLRVDSFSCAAPWLCGAVLAI